ncbi:protein KTI12 homolog [Chelonus insularis]|uniref:protein KTI12 homolog n=1 Tax=Chelonus insularis TaxID=460826 RepID=UPI00158DCB61|nr:protein KTI12 homolog [Chelonus insularis]
MKKMPLIIITGTPTSGKSTRALELRKYFIEICEKKVDIISEIQIITKSGYNKNILYADSKKEKAIRNDIRSSTQHLLNKNDILIIDGSNYIKGYRYELYCLSKSLKTPQCTIYCEVPTEHSWLLNEQKPDDDKYSREIFDSLITRYEPPDSKNRWDAPLFSVTLHDKLPLDDIYKSLYLVKPPKPNMSTEPVPLLSTNTLFQLNKITQEIIDEILEAEALGITSNIKLKRFNLFVERGASASQLSRLKQSFLSCSKMLQMNTEEIPFLFVKFLNQYL